MRSRKITELLGHGDTDRLQDKIFFDFILALLVNVNQFLKGDSAIWVLSFSVKGHLRSFVVSPPSRVSSPSRVASPSGVVASA